MSDCPHNASEHWCDPELYDPPPNTVLPPLSDDERHAEAIAAAQERDWRDEGYEP
jgi:hypothetical protein